jgi:serine protease Do
LAKSIFNAFPADMRRLPKRRPIFSRYTLLLGLGCLIFAGLAWSSGQGGKSVVFPLTQKEAETLTVDWLENRGFAVEREVLDMGRLEIRGVKAGAIWCIRLQPRSSLATRVQAHYSVEGSSSPHAERELWAHLSGEIPQPLVTAPAGSSQYVPPEVLLRMESVVCVRAELKQREVRFSGFVVDRKGLILCTAHDLEGIQQMFVSLFNGRELKARIVKKDPFRDLILLRIQLKLDNHIPLNEGRNLIGMGEQLYTVGCPVNLGGTVHSGFVNGPPRRVEGLPLWQVDLDILPGSSGSPVFDIQGNLVGMVKGRYRGTKSVGFLIPIETMTAFMKER